jgi:hypothetical protein
MQVFTLEEGRELMISDRIKQGVPGIQAKKTPILKGK